MKRSFKQSRPSLNFDFLNSKQNHKEKRHKKKNYTKEKKTQEKSVVEGV
jgi:hypothetical protein